MSNFKACITYWIGGWIIISISLYNGGVFYPFIKNQSAPSNRWRKLIHPSLRPYLISLKISVLAKEYAKRFLALSMREGPHQTLVTPTVVLCRIHQRRSERIFECREQCWFGAEDPGRILCHENSCLPHQAGLFIFSLRYQVFVLYPKGDGLSLRATGLFQWTLSGLNQQGFKGTERILSSLWGCEGLKHNCPNGLFLFTAGLFYKKWDGLKISPIC